MSQNQALLDQAARDQSLLAEEQALRLRLQAEAKAVSARAEGASAELEKVGDVNRRQLGMARELGDSDLNQGPELRICAQERVAALALKAALKAAEKEVADAAATNDAIRLRMDQVCLQREVQGHHVGLGCTGRTASSGCMLSP